MYHDHNMPSHLSPQCLCDNSCTWAHIRFFGFFEISFHYPESNLKSKLILLLRFHHQSYIWQNSDLCNIPRKK